MNCFLQSQLNVVVARRNTAPLAGLSSATSNSSSNNCLENLVTSSTTQTNVDFNNRKDSTTSLTEKKKFEKLNDPEIFYRSGSVIDKMSDKNTEKNIINVGYLMGEKSISLFETKFGINESFNKLSMNGNAPLKISKQIENNFTPPSKNRNLSHENIARTITDIDIEYDHHSGLNKIKTRPSSSCYSINNIDTNDEKEEIKDKKEKKPKKKGSISLLNMTSNNLNCPISSIPKDGDTIPSPFKRSSLTRSASAPLDCRLDDVEDKNFDEKCRIDKNVISGIALYSSKSNYTNVNDSKLTSLISTEETKKSDGASYIGVPFSGKQSRNIWKDRLLI